MAASALFLGFGLLLWLALGLAGWLAATLALRPRASLLALLAALAVAPIGGALPGLLGWESAYGLLCGLALAPTAATLAAWEILRRRSAPPAVQPEQTDG